MELYLIRHTALDSTTGICYGRTDVPLAASAEQDIQRVLAVLPTFEHVYSSPAQRCTRLAEALALRDQCALTVDPALGELDL